MQGKHVINYDNKVVAELYDMNENYTDDVELLKSLIGQEKLNILECFAGTGRILIPLALDGHRLTGIDLASSMLERAQQKLDGLGEALSNKVTLINEDIVKADWGSGYDLVIIGCNAFYDLSSSDLQEACIKRAYEALKPGGYIFIDNNDYKGNWGSISCDVERVIFEGIISDGTFAQMTLKHNSFDNENNILDFTHKVYIRTPEGKEENYIYNRCKHPVTAEEVRGWLLKYGFNILKFYGDIKGNPYTKESNRAIFWARK